MWCYVRAVQAGQMNLIEFLNEAKRIGADGVELLDFFYKDPHSERDDVKAKLKELDLPCGIFSVANNFATLDTVQRSDQVGRIQFGVDEATFFGAKVVRVFAGDIAEGISSEQARAWIIDGLVESANYASTKGVKLALENHGKLAGRGDQVRAIVEDVRAKCGHDSMGANPDTGNFLLVDQDSAEAVGQVADMAYMCHFKDFAPGDGVYSSLAGTKFKGTVIGEGSVDLSGCVKVLNDAGFDGWFSLEYEGEGDPMVEVEQSLRNAKGILSGSTV